LNRNDQEFDRETSAVAPAALRRHLSSLGASLVAHAALLAAIVYFSPPLATHHSEWVLAYLIEVGPGSGAAKHGSGGGREASPASRVAFAASPPQASLPATRHRRIADRRDELRPPVSTAAAITHEAHAAIGAEARAIASRDSAGASAKSQSPAGEQYGSIASAGGAMSSGQSAGTGGALGSGDGERLAYADYGANPPPRYPVDARRRNQQGTVTLRVLVGSDGSVERVEIAESSGVESLDAAALEAVRSRWRFVAARRNGVSIESWVLVPIRFALKDGRAAE